MLKYLLVDVGWGNTPKWISNVLQPVLDVLDSLLLPIIIILGTAGLIYGIVLGVQFAKAESADKRDESKKRMINAVIGIVIMLVLLILMKVFTANADSMFGWVDTSSGRVVVTIEIGESKEKQSEEGAAKILVALEAYDSLEDALDFVEGKSSVTASFSQEEWKKVKGNLKETAGVTVTGEKADSETNSIENIPSYWVEYKVA